jgi:LmbE family N-acetylglucosaminyl deacetylase
VNLVISPHFDDAVLSAGAWLTRHPGATVATVFSGLPGEGVVAHEWDFNGGFTTGNDAATGRRAEDAGALELLQADQVVLGFLDGPYRPMTGRIHESEDIYNGDIHAAITTSLRQLLEGLRPRRCYFPLGALHEDHHIASNAAVAAILEADLPAIAYTDLPYAFSFPDFPAQRIAELQGMGCRVTEYPTMLGDYLLKREAVSCYQSQLGLVGTDGCFDEGAERFYRVVLR